MSSAPLVYCETNWLVALAFPHHQLHSAAVQLRDHARAERCRLRVPFAAYLEARHPLNEFSAQLNKTFASLRDDVQRALQNGHAGFAALAPALLSTEVEAYARRDTLAILRDVETDTAITKLADMSGIINVMSELRPKVELSGKDVIDLHLLAAIIHDRRRDLQGPAVFFSANKKDFQPNRKVPESIYAQERLVWREDFVLESALGRWNSKYEIPSTSPA